MDGVVYQTPKTSIPRPLIKTELHKKRSNTGRFVLSWLVIALLIRIVFVLVLEPDKYYFSDTRHYDAAARYLLEHGNLPKDYYRAPLYPALMAGIYAVAGHSFLAVRLFEVLLGVLLCLLIYHLANNLFGSNVAKLSLVLSVFFPHFIILSGILYPTLSFTLLLILCVFLLFRHEHGLLYAFLAGSFAALAALNRPAVFFLVPAWLIWLLWDRTFLMKKRILRLVLFIFGLLLTLTPWTIRNYHVYHRLVLVQNLPHTVLPDLENQDANKHEINSGFQKTVDYLRNNPTGSQKDALSKTIMHYLHDPVGTLKYVTKEMIHFWSPYPDRLDSGDPNYRSAIHSQDQRMFTNGELFWKLVPYFSTIIMVPTMLLALFGLLLLYPWNQKMIFLLLSIASMALGYSLIYAEVRYRIPVEPLIIMFTAIGLERLTHISKKLPFNVNH